MQKEAPEGGVEPPTLRLKAARSSQLSYPGTTGGFMAIKPIIKPPIRLAWLARPT